MSFASVSIIADGKLVGTETAPVTASARGYHLLVVEGHSRLSPDFIWSRMFTIGGRCWRIAYIPCSNLTDYAGFMSLFLLLSESTEDPVKTEFRFSFIDETDNQDPAGTHRVNFQGYTSEGNRRFIARDALEKSKHLKNDSFTIRCDALVLNPTCSAAPFIDVPPSEMRQNLADLLLAGEGTDVVFQVGGETIPAHRCIVAARSAVFRALLFGSMKEGTSTVVQIDDMEASVFKALLGFIYGDSLPAMGEDEEEEHGGLLLQHLLVAADRYGLGRLRAMCEGKLCEHIGVSTATTILALAEQHGCHGLKDACYEFLRCPANLRAVVATDGFDHLCRSCPPVMKDLILGMLHAPK